MFIIIKTICNDKNNVKSELISQHNTCAEACEKMSTLIENKYENKAKSDGLVKIYEKGFIYNTISHIYQLLEIQDL